MRTLTRITLSVPEGFFPGGQQRSNSLWLGLQRLPTTEILSQGRTSSYGARRRCVIPHNQVRQHLGQCPGSCRRPQDELRSVRP